MDVGLTPSARCHLKLGSPAPGERAVTFDPRLHQNSGIAEFQDTGVFSEISDLHWLWLRVAGPGHTSCASPGLSHMSTAQLSGTRAEGQVQPRALSPHTCFMPCSQRRVWAVPTSDSAPGLR